MKLFSDIKSSFGNKAFYGKVIEGNLGSAFKYYFKLTFLLALIAMVIAGIFWAPQVSKFVEKATSELLIAFPEGLTVQFQKGVVSTNMLEPVTIPLTPEIKKDFSKKDFEMVESLTVIDTKSVATPESFVALKTFMLVSKDFIVYHDDKGGLVFKSVKSFPDLKIDKTFSYKSFSYKKFVPSIVVLMFGIGTFFALIFNAVILILAAFIFMGLTHLFGQKFSFRISYMVLLYAATLPTLLEVIVFNNSLGVPFLFSLIAILIAILGTKGYMHDTTEVVPH